MKRIVIILIFFSLPLAAGNPFKALFGKKSEEKGFSHPGRGAGSSWGPRAVQEATLDVLHILALLEHKETHLTLSSQHLKCVLGENNTFNTVTKDFVRLNSQYSVGITLKALNRIAQNITLDYGFNHIGDLCSTSIIKPLEMGFNDSFRSDNDSSIVLVYGTHPIGIQMPHLIKIQTYTTQEYLPVNLLPQVSNSNN